MVVHVVADRKSVLFIGVIRTFYSTYLTGGLMLSRARQRVAGGRYFRGKGRIRLGPACAVGLGVFFASSIGALDERICVVQQEVAVLPVESERLREDVSAIRTLLETHVLTADPGAD